MARFGQGINPQLGATDYSGFLQGSLQGAQMQARGGEAIGQGLAALGQGLGAGIKGYLEKKELNKTTDSTIERLQNNPIAIKFLGLDPEQAKDKAMWKEGIKSVGGGDIKAGLTALTSMLPKLEQFQEEQQKGQRSAAVANLLRMGGGQMPENIDAGVYAPDEIQAGLNMFLQQEELRSKAAKNFQEAETQPATPQGRIVTEKQLAELEAGGQKFDSVPLQDGKYLVKGRSTRAEPPPRHVLSPQEQAEADELKSVSADAFKRVQQVHDAAESAYHGITEVRELKSLFQSGLKTGWGQEFLIGAKRFANAIGMKDFDVSNAEQAQVLFGDFIMRRVQETKGAISNKEMDLFKEFGPNLSKTAEGNLRIIEWYEKIAERALTEEAMVSEMRDKGYGSTKIADAIRDTRRKNVIRLDASGVSAPKGVETSIWNAMTPEEKARFKK